MISPREAPGLPDPPLLGSLPEPPETRVLKWALFGSHGLRVGWSVALFALLFLFFSGILQTIAILTVSQPFHIDLHVFTPASALLLEVVQVIPLLAAATVCALVERRRIGDYNLRGPRRLRHFSAGILAGFAALSLLVGVLDAGGWLRFGPSPLGGAALARFAAIWALVFLLTASYEEGSMRCYLLYTLARGTNFWWALGSVAALCFFNGLNSHANGADGVYLMTLLGVAPCLMLYLKHSPSAGFWQAAWFTSTFFGYIHTFNAGESWIGIFAASAVGLLFCVSVRVTGSAWWAIGFHAAWDWAQTFFYGTPDSGLAAQGHYLSTTPAGPAFWSGGGTGPEGSILVVPVILLVLLGLIVVSGRPGKALKSPTEAESAQLS